MTPPKTIQGLASAIAKIEGKKSQARIGDIREILGILSDIAFADRVNENTWQLHAMLEENGAKRAKRKKK